MANYASTSPNTDFIQRLQHFRPSNLQKRNPKPFRNWSYRRIGPFNPMLHLHPLHGSQKDWGSKTSHRPASTQRICKIPAFQNRKFGLRKIVNSTQRLHDLYRPQPSFLSRFPCFFPKTFLHLRFPRQTLLLQMFTFWVDFESTNIHKGTLTFNKNNKIQRNLRRSLFRRYTTNGSIQRRSVTIYHFPHTMSTTLRFHHKRKEVVTRSFSRDRLSRIPNRLKNDGHETSQKKVTESHQGLSKGKATCTHAYPKTSFSDREDYSHRQRNIPGTPLLTGSTPRQKFGSKEEWLERFGYTIGRQSTTTRLVDTKITGLQWKIPHPRKSIKRPIHRRIQYRLGSNTKRGDDNSRTLESSRKQTSYKPVGNEGNLFCSSRLSGHLQPVNTSTDRQYNMRRLHQSSRRHNVSNLIKRCRNSLGIMFKSKHTLTGRTRSRNNERISGSCIPTHFRPSRLETKSDNIPAIKLHMGPIPDRSFCQSHKHPTPEVLLLDSGPVCGSNRCFSPIMEQTEPMGESTLDSNPSDPVKDNPRKSYFDYSGPSLGISSVVPDFTEPSHSTSDSDINGTHRTPNRQSTSLSSPQSAVVPLRMQNIRSRYETKGFSEKAINLLISALDSNSSRTMSSNLRQWVSWCQLNTVDPIACPVNDICDFFVDMLAKGLAYNTIAGYRTAISECHDYVDGAPIGSHPDVSKVLQAIHVHNPLSIHSDEPIDIIFSLKYICHLGDNTSMSIRDLSVKTAFLLALVTACRPSDLKRIDLTSARTTSSSYSFDCILPKEYKIAKSHSPSTTKSPVKRIFIGSYPEDLSLCPFDSLQTLLSRTATWRTSPTQKRSLFLITRDPHTPAATDTIAGWIKSIIRLSSPTSSAKDMRVLSAFFLQNAGADLASVLALGNWSSNSIYQRFYQRGIKLMLEKNQSSSLILKEANVHSNDVVLRSST